MSSPALPTRAPASVPAHELALAAPLDRSFEGFGEEALQILDRLRETPHIEQYRLEKEGIQAHLKAPFKRFRDDLAVNFVLPNRLALETEKNVFSRLLKNDFGAGGCHHHLWMAFYRLGHKRLTDVQLSHSIAPDHFTTGLYVGDYATEPLKRAQGYLHTAPETFLGLVNPLLDEPGWRLASYAGTGKQKTRTRHETPLDALPEAFAKARGLWVQRQLPRPEVLRRGPHLVDWALETLLDLWPIYRFWLSGAA
ncbi:MAG: hypothetical protein AAGI71_08165 [Bacteroidota bacterium]